MKSNSFLTHQMPAYQMTHQMTCNFVTSIWKASSTFHEYGSRSRKEITLFMSQQIVTFSKCWFSFSRGQTMHYTSCFL